MTVTQKLDCDVFARRRVSIMGNETLQNDIIHLKIPSLSSFDDRHQECLDKFPAFFLFLPS